MHKEFQDWLSSSDEGWLLLDSVDEARLRHPADFELAIQRMSETLAKKGGSSRAHIVLTSRIGAWRPVTDLVLCRDLLPHPTPRSGRRVAIENPDDTATAGFETVEDLEGESDEIAPGFAIVGLDELSDDQIGRFAAAKGVHDTRAFLEDIERKDATAFARRPQDLEDIVQFWLEHGRVGTRWEMMSANVARRLTERDQTRAEAGHLSAERAREGVRTLAAATTLSGVQTIRLPDGASGIDEGIDVAGVLAGWQSAEIAVLLQRPIFDPAIYSTVRFHHRSVREFLAAEWFADLLAKAPSRVGLEMLFFRKKFGIEIVTPLLRPVLPWLVTQEPGMRARLMDLAPEVVFEGGDPGRLPIDDRRRILAEVCQLLASGASGRSSLDYASVQRFADDANEHLTQDIRILLRKYANHEDVAPFLLRMVWLGRLSDALPEVLEFAQDATDQGYRRLTALKALRSIADKETLDAVMSDFLGEAGDRPRRLVAEILSGLGGDVSDVTWFLSAAERAEPRRKHTVDYLSSEAGLFVGRVDLDVLPLLVEGMAAHLSRSPVVERLYNRVSVRFEWLLGPAARAVERLILDRRPSALSPAALSIVRMVSAARIYHNDVVTSEKDQLAGLVPAWPELNRAQFWYDVERMRAELPGGQQLLEWWRPSNFGAAWRFSAADFDFALDAINARPLIDDRMVALSLAFELYRLNQRPRRWLNALKRVSAEPQLSARLHALLHPTPDPEMKRYRASERQRLKRQDKQKEQEATNLTQSREYLTANVASIRSGLAADPGSAADHRAIHYLFHRMRDSRDTVNRWSDYDWTSLKDQFGDAVSQMFRDAARAYWRHNRPMLHNEGAADNQTPFSTILGLTGLEIETSESIAVLAQLTPSEVDTAARYAVSELNGFPSWFPALFEHHPQLVTDFLVAQIRYEAFSLPPDRSGDDILSDVSWTGQWAWERLGPMLLGLLTLGEPKNAKALGCVLKILKSSSVADGQLAVVARDYALDSASAHPGHWFAFWIGVDPDQAILAFEERLNSLTQVEATDLAMRTAVRLFGNRFDEPGIARERFLHPPSLVALHRMLHCHVRRSEDIQRGNSGVYSPGLRDHAQEARDSILDRLRDASGKEAFLGLRSIIESQPDRPWLRRLLSEKALREGDIDPFSVDDILPLATNFERNPRTADQLADTALVRLLQAKDGGGMAGTLPAAFMNVGNAIEAAESFAGEMSTTIGSAFAAIHEGGKPWLDLSGVGHPAGHRIWFTVVPHGNQVDNESWLKPAEGRPISRRRTLALIRTVRNEGWRWPWAREPDLAKAKTEAEAHWCMVEPTEPYIDDVDIVTVDLTNVNSAVAPRDMLDRILEFLRWHFGSSVIRLGTTLAVLGATSLTGLGQVFLEAVAKHIFGADIDLGGPALWVGWTLVTVGLAVALLGHFLPKR